MEKQAMCFGLIQPPPSFFWCYTLQIISNSNCTHATTASNYTCVLVAIKEALNLYYSKAIQNSNGLLLFSDSRTALQAILRGNSQLTRDIILLLNKLTTAQRTCILQWIPAHVDIDEKRCWQF